MRDRDNYSDDEWDIIGGIMDDLPLLFYGYDQKESFEEAVLKLAEIIKANRALENQLNIPAEIHVRCEVRIGNDCAVGMFTFNGKRLWNSETIEIPVTETAVYDALTLRFLSKVYRVKLIRRTRVENKDVVVFVANEISVTFDEHGND